MEAVLVEMSTQAPVRECRAPAHHEVYATITRYGRVSIVADLLKIVCPIVSMSGSS